MKARTWNPRKDVGWKYKYSESQFWKVLQDLVWREVGAVGFFTRKGKTLSRKDVPFANELVFQTRQNISFSDLY